MLSSNRWFTTAKWGKQGTFCSMETDLFFQKWQLHHALVSDRMASVEEHMSDAQTKVSSKVKEKRKFEALLVKQTSRADNGDCQVVNLFSKQLEAPHLAAQLPHQSNPSLSGPLPYWLYYR